MRGQYNGLQKYIRDENPQATYIWCCSHRLNLVVVVAVSEALNAVDLFGNIERLYDFISSSKFRSAMYEKKQRQLYPEKQIRKLKRVSTTRWMSHKSALDVILNTYIAILETLESIKEEGSDKKAASEINGFLLYLQSTRFIYSAFCFQKILSILEPVSTLLQKKDFDLLSVSYLIKQKYNQLVLIRCETALNKILSEADNFITSISKSFDIKPLPKNRLRKKKILPGEKAEDELITDPLVHFRIDTYFNTLDITISEIKRRFFGDGVDNIQQIGLFKDLSLMTQKRMKEIKKNSSSIPKDAFESFSNIYGRFINNNVSKLREEYINFSGCFEQFLITENLPDSLHKQYDEDTESNSDTFDEDEDYSVKQSIENNASLFPIFRFVQILIILIAINIVHIY